MLCEEGEPPTPQDPTRLEIIFRAYVIRMRKNSQEAPLRAGRRIWENNERIVRVFRSPKR